MPRLLADTIKFDTKASRLKHAVVVIYDLTGFSKFLNQPDVHEYVPCFLNHISNVISAIIYGGNRYWETPHKKWRALPAPVHEKFLGDGALYIWLPPRNAKEFPPSFIANLCNSLWNIQSDFEKILKACADDIPIYEIPQGIRFGLARGTIYELTNRETREREYIGVCINLASRLQKYCSDLAFIASARIGIPGAKLSRWGYIKVIATKIKGFPKEIVIVDKNEYNALPEEIRSDLFESLPE